MLIAIDGTASSGKGTLARLLASTMGLTHVDSGKFYRAVGLAAHKQGISPADSRALISLLDRINMSDLKDPNLSGRLAGQLAAEYSPNAVLRSRVTAKLRELAQSLGNVVMDGRDIGTEVLPFAEVKIFVDADVRVRAMRRARELKQIGLAVEVEEVMADLKERDQRDRLRVAAPLKAAADAMILDTTHLEVEGTLRQALCFIDDRVGKRSRRSTVP
jgi:cytidylate kinase